MTLLPAGEKPVGSCPVLLELRPPRNQPDPETPSDIHESMIPEQTPDQGTGFPSLSHRWERFEFRRSWMIGVRHPAYFISLMSLSYMLVQ